jgi:hypothetical protein
VKNLGSILGSLPEISMAAIRMEAGTGLLGRFEFVRVSQERWQKGPFPANPGLHRMHPTAVVRQKDAGPAAAGDLGAQGGMNEIPALQLILGEVQERG